MRSVKILFVHQNFPGQFVHLAPALAAAGHDVVAMTTKEAPAGDWNGVRMVRYGLPRGTTPGVHPWLSDMEAKVVRGEACLRAALALKGEGFVPEVIIAHPGWGESLFLKDVWPAARLGIYCEFFYSATGLDIDFDPEFQAPDPTTPARIRLKNLHNLINFEVADAGISPTHWQASTFPPSFRDKISVIHDGIDTTVVRPDPHVSLTLDGQLTLTRSDEVVTFVNRTLEPYRGYHVFMRALPDLLSMRPDARVLIVGGVAGGYGAQPPLGETWRDLFINEVRPRISDEDWSRVHFLGNIAYQHFLPLLQLSKAHVYLTYPFVLSWSLVEAMSAGCPIVASGTQPVSEVIEHGVTGQLVDFFNPRQLAEEISVMLENPAQAQRMGQAAREAAVKKYDLTSVCLPAQIRWVESLFA